ncbi:MAG: 3-deoxy-7-phosphoheptulonate synthase, partial [Anaerotignaceae bacterium]
MKPTATKDDVAKIVENLKACGLDAHLSTGEAVTIIGVVGDKSIFLEKNPQLMNGVEKIVHVTESYKLANKKFHPEPSVIDIDGLKIGGDNFVIMAGPCAVESEELMYETAEAIVSGGAQVLRGGAYKPRTSPYSFQGLEAEGLQYLQNAKKKYGVKTISEVTSFAAIEESKKYVDIIQIGARNMHNFELLKRAGKSGMPVLLKRGMSATIDEWLNAAEYIMSEGNERVILCERGIRTYENSTRNTLDLSAIPVIKAKSHLPIIVDPSHATGVRDYVAPLAKAAVAAGADGLMIEVHPNPAIALSDGPQSLNPHDFKVLCEELRPFIKLMGRKF